MAFLLKFFFLTISEAIKLQNEKWKQNVQSEKSSQYTVKVKMIAKTNIRDIRCTMHNYSLIYNIQFQFLPIKRCILFIYSFIQHKSIITVTAIMTRGSRTVHLCVIPDPGSRRQIWFLLNNIILFYWNFWEQSRWLDSRYIRAKIEENMQF